MNPKPAVFKTFMFDWRACFISFNSLRAFVKFRIADAKVSKVYCQRIHFQVACFNKRTCSKSLELQTI